MRLVLPLTLLHFVLRANGLSLFHPERWFERNDDAGDAIKPHRMSRSAPTLPDPTELKARWEAELKPPKGRGRRHEEVGRQAIDMDRFRREPK